MNLRSPPRGYSDRIRPNPTKSDRVRPNPTESDQIRPNWPIYQKSKSDRIRPNPTESDQIRPNPTKSDRIRRSDSVGVASGRGSHIVSHSVNHPSMGGQNMTWSDKDLMVNEVLRILRILQNCNVYCSWLEQTRGGSAVGEDVLMGAGCASIKRQPFHSVALLMESHVWPVTPKRSQSMALID